MCRRLDPPSTQAARIDARTAFSPFLRIPRRFSGEEIRISKLENQNAPRQPAPHPTILRFAF